MEKIIKKGAAFSLFEHLNIGLIIACTIILAVCQLFTDRIFIGDSYTQEIEPYTVASLEDGSKEYFFDLSDYDYHYSAIRFYTSHQIIKAYNSNREIYSFDTTGGFWTSTTGSTYNFIDINDNMRKIAIVVGSGQEG